MGTERERAKEQAAEWLAKLNTRSVTTAELEAFYAWRKEGEHAEAYAHAEAIWRQSRTLGDDPDIAAAVRDALGRPRLGRASWSPSRRMVLAGAGMIPIAAGATWFLLSRGRSYETRVGEQLLVSLADGSRVRLNTDSRLQVHADHDGGGRRVTLDRGQAFFEVKPDPARPFEVHSEFASVRAMGTKFDVHLAARQVQVVLAEGSVLVDPGQGISPTPLRVPGESAIVGGQGQLKTARVDLEAATCWTLGRMVFHATPLAAAIAEANRYSTVPIELEDETLARAKVDGTFETGDMDSFLAAVSALFSLKQKRMENKILLSRS